MSIELAMPDLKELKPNITVIGVGGAGGNAVNNMIRSELHGVEFVAMNTDAQALSHSLADRKMQLGVKITQGLGAGSQPDIGRAAAEENIDAIEDALAGCHMAFITAGMGGGTGTGASPVVAQLAKEKGILTVAVVTKPFHFEGARRMALADAGIQELEDHVDTLIIIPNQNLFRVANEKTTFADAFGLADQVLHSGVRGVTDLMVMPGLINLDFADVRAVMHGMGQAMMGTGEAEGDNRAVEAAEAAISNPLLDDVSMRGAKGVIINITGGMDLTLFEVDEAANHIRSQVDPEANIIVGSAFSEDLNGQMRVSVVATGVQIEARQGDDTRRMNGLQMLTESGAVRANPRPAVVASSETAAALQSDETRDEVAELPRETREVEEEPVETVALEVAFDDADVAVEEPATMPVEAASAEEAADEGEEIEDIEDRLAEDAFVSPAPQMPEEAPPAADEPEPFAAAAMANGTRSDGGTEDADEPVAEAPQPARAQPVPSGHASLFERMTGAFRASEKAAADEDEAEEEAKPAIPAVTTVDTESLDRPVYRHEAKSAEIGRIGREDRAVPEGEVDQLEIPAFLRRQVN